MYKEITDEYGFTTLVWELPPQQSSSDLPNKLDVPIWCKYTLSIEEASQLFRIGENKLRNIINENPNRNFILWNGNRAQIKRDLFAKFIDSTNAI